MVVSIFPTVAKALLGLFCYSNCIQLCPYIKLSSWHQQNGERNRVVSAVACRDLVMPGATAWLDAPTKFQYWAVACRWWPFYWIHSTLFVTSQHDVIFTFANQRFGEVCWHNMHIQGPRSSGSVGRAVKMLRAMETYKKQKNRYHLCLFPFINNVNLKNNNRNYRKSFRIIWVPE